MSRRAAYGERASFKVLFRATTVPTNANCCFLLRELSLEDNSDLFSDSVLVS
jgi:hypothetical protein